MRYGRPSWRAQREPAFHHVQRLRDPARDLQRPDERADRLQHQRAVVERFGLASTWRAMRSCASRSPAIAREVAHLVRGEQRASRARPRPRTAPAPRSTSAIAASASPRPTRGSSRDGTSPPPAARGRRTPPRAARSCAWRGSRPDGSASSRCSTTHSACQSIASNTSSQRRSPCGSISSSAESRPIDSRWCSSASAWRERAAQRVDGFGVAAARRAHEVLRGRAEPARLHERARRVTVQRAPPGRADARVDRLLEQRVHDLVAARRARCLPRGRSAAARARAARRRASRDHDRRCARDRSARRGIRAPRRARASRVRPARAP